MRKDQGDSLSYFSQDPNTDLEENLECIFKHFHLIHEEYVKPELLGDGCSKLDGLSCMCVRENMAAEKTDFILRTTPAATCALLLEVVIKMVDNYLFWRILRTKFST